MKGKLIVVEGTDCSGKETQTKLLIEHMKKEGLKVEKFSFPMYDAPTGKIVGGPYLGKSYICNGWFSEGAALVDGKVASLYYAADRLYNIKSITNRFQKPSYVPKDSYLVKTLCKVFNEETNSNYEPIAIGGGTYARAFKNCISFGANMPGDTDMCHQANEFIKIDNLILSSKIYAKAILELDNYQ